MPSMTITEALADIKTSLARIQKKREAVQAYLYRDSRLRDPLERSTEGSSREFVSRERQAISDLETKIVKIRAAIQAKNLVTVVEIEGEKDTLANWLTWRREIVPGRRSFLSAMSARIQGARNQAQKLGGTVRVDGSQETAAGDVLVSVSESDLAAEIDGLESIVGQLDGKLSLLNATTLVEL